MSKCRESFLFIGDTGVGKTATLGELAEEAFRRTGKKTRLYCADGGGWGTVDAHVAEGLIEPIMLTDYAYPWAWFDYAVRGALPLDRSDPLTKWEIFPKENAAVGLFAYEGLTGCGDALMRDLARQSAEGKKIGGDAPINFEGRPASAGIPAMKIGGNNMAHYNIVQRRLADGVETSQHLGEGEWYLAWSALLLRTTDDVTKMPILGPQLVGKALTTECPRWFGNTFRVAAYPTKEGKMVRRLYLDEHLDPESGVMCLAKNRGNKEFPLPNFIEPPSMQEALRLIEESQLKGRSALKARMSPVTL